MQVNKNKNNYTDFILFLKKNWQYSDFSFQKKILPDFLHKKNNQEIISSKERAKRFYRALEDGKLNKVLNTVVKDTVEETREDRDDTSAKYWQDEKEKSEDEILKQDEAAALASLKANAKKKNHFTKILTNPINHSLKHGQSLNIGLGTFTNNLSLTWKYVAVSIVLMFLSIGYLSLYPDKAQESIARLDSLVAYPLAQTLTIARHFQLIPDLEYNEKFVNSLPSLTPAINSSVKSNYIKNINQQAEITIINDGDHVNITKEDILSILAQADIKPEIVVLGVDSDVDQKSDNKIIKVVKNFLKKIAKKQERLSLDLNNKLIELIEE